MIIEFLILFGCFLEANDSHISENLKKCILFKIKDQPRLEGCLYVPNNYPLHKFKPMNIPKEEKSSMASLFSINKPLYEEWGMMDKPEYIILAFDNTQVIGGIRVIKDKKNDYIEHLYVLDKYRSQSVGSRLLEICTVIAHCRKKNFIQLDAVPFDLKNFERLEKFYIKCGFFLNEGSLIKKTSSTFENDTIAEIKYL